MILYQVKESCIPLLNTVIRILKSEYAIILITTFTTTYLTYYFGVRKERKIAERNKISEISGLLYLIRTTFYQIYEAKLHSNYYEQLSVIKTESTQFYKKQEILENSFARKKSEDLYKLYKNLNQEITSLRQLKKLSNSTEEKITKILDYTTLTFSRNYKKFKTSEEVENYKIIIMKEILKNQEEMKNLFKSLISDFKS
jgi:hypothetical protein